MLTLAIIAPDADLGFQPTGRSLFIRPRAIAVAEGSSSLAFYIDNLLAGR